MLVRTWMRGQPPQLIVELTVEERRFLEKQAATRTAPYCQVQRAKAVLLAAQGLRNVEIAAKTDQDPRTVSILRKEFLARRLDALKDNQRAGRGRSFSP